MARIINIEVSAKLSLQQTVGFWIFMVLQQLLFSQGV